MMKIIRRDPHHKHLRPLTPFDESLWEPFSILPAFLGRSDDHYHQNFFPSADVSESDTEIVIEAEIPGYDAKHITVEIDQDVVCIRGKTEEEKEEKKKYYRKERRCQEFSREFTLPGYADTENAKCKVKNGVLSLTIPKRIGSQKKVVDIKVE